MTNSFVADSVNYKGLPADRSTTGGWLSAALILGIEICERLTSMGIAVNLVTFLVGTMHLPSSTSAKIVSDFAGTSFLLCLLGGLLADSFLGRYWTIAIFSLIQALGTGLLATFTGVPKLLPPPCDATQMHECPQANRVQMAMLYISLYTIAIGTGGIKASVSGFGTDQFDQNHEKEKAQMAYFFNRFFFFISIGTLLAVSVLVYIQDEVGRSWGYGICSVSTFLATLVFLSRTRRYRYKKCSGSPLVQIVQVIVATIRKRNLNSDVNALYESSPEASRIHHTDQFRCLDKATIRTEGDFETSSTSSSTPNPWKLCSVTRVEELKMVIKILPIWATTIMFWTIHAQMITFSVEQASTMKRSIGKFLIPSGSFTAFFIAALLVTLTVYDRLIMPIWKKRKGKQGFTNLQRIGIGLSFSIIGMAVASLAETKRLSVAKSVSASTKTLPISAFLLLPQFILVGAGEAFMYTGQLDFFITQSPKGMKAMSTGLFLTTIALGYFFTSFLVIVVKKVTGNHGHGWLADSINKGRLDYFYALLAVLSFINLGLYLLCAVWYKPNTTHEQHALQLQEIVINGSSAEETQER